MAFDIILLYPSSTSNKNEILHTYSNYCKITGNYYDLKHFFFLNKFEEVSLTDTTFLQKESAFLNQTSFGVYTSSAPAPFLIIFFTLFNSFLYESYMFFILCFDKSSQGILNPDSIRFFIKIFNLCSRTFFFR